MLKGLEYLESIPFWNGKEKFDLSNIRELVAALGNPEKSLRIIHVAGTNGKGSVCASLASILKESGASVGLFTSPHLSRINERFQINGSHIDDRKLSEALLKVKEVCIKHGIEASYFEIVTATAFIVFQGLDWVVLETGLGGRLDSTNVIESPALSIITNIGADHQQILGDSEEDIAAEKAGIIKEGVPVIVGECSDSVFNVISRVADNIVESRIESKTESRGNQIFRQGTHFKLTQQGCNGEAIISIDNKEYQYIINLQGSHQLSNTALAFAAAIKLGLDPECCQKGLKNIFWPGRLEKIVTASGQEVWLDCAHNIPGVNSLISFLDTRALKEVDIFFGVTEGKEWQEMIALLKDYIVNWNIVSLPVTRGFSSEELVSYLKAEGQSVSLIGEDYSRIKRMLTQEKSMRPCLVAGSVYLIGLVREMLRPEN